MQQIPKTLAMILAGGRVDDLSVLTRHRPKAALPFGGFARVIDFPLSNLMASGLERVGILSQYQSYSLINHIGIGAAWDMVGRYRGITILPPFHGSEDSRWYRGSADAVYQNLSFCRNHPAENILILSGDHVYHMDYRELISFHQAARADLTVAFIAVPPRLSANRFGVAEIDEEYGGRGGRVLSYEEKPDSPRGEWASLTIYCFRPEILFASLAANTAEDDSHEFGRDIIPRLLAENRRVYGFKFRGYWGYTRTLEEYWQTNMDLLGPEPKIPLREWGVRTNLEDRRMRDCPPLKLGSAAEVVNSLVYNGCTVEGRVENSILFPRVRVDKGATVRDSIIFYNNRIGENCRLHRVISDINNRFDPETIADGEEDKAGSDLTVIGADNAIPAGTVIGPGAILYPERPAGSIPSIISAGTTVR